MRTLTVFSPENGTLLITQRGSSTTTTTIAVAITSTPVSGVSVIVSNTPSGTGCNPATTPTPASLAWTAGAVCIVKFQDPVVIGGLEYAFTGSSTNGGPSVPANPLTVNSGTAAITINGIYRQVNSGAPNGGISVFATNDTDVVLDITGYFVPAGTPGALSFYPMTPCRLVDTRNGTLVSGAIAGGTSKTLPLMSSSCGIPVTAQAYSLNFMAAPTGGGPLGYIQAWPTGQPNPGTSVLNAPTGTVTANAAIISAAGTNGSVDVFASNTTDWWWTSTDTGLCRGQRGYPSTACRNAGHWILGVPEAAGPSPALLTWMSWRAGAAV